MELLYGWLYIISENNRYTKNIKNIPHFIAIANGKILRFNL